MKTIIDVKSALIGLVIGVGVMMVMGASESRPVQRYHVSASSSTLVIVDTITGEAWASQPGGGSVSGSPGGFYSKKSQ